jgi:hypothetical protein
VSRFNRGRVHVVPHLQTKNPTARFLEGHNERSGREKNSMDMYTSPRSRLTAAIDHGPAHLRPIMRAVRDGGVAFCIVPQGGESFDLPTNRPNVLLICDDMFESCGPKPFHQE